MSIVAHDVDAGYAIIGGDKKALVVFTDVKQLKTPVLINWNAYKYAPWGTDNLEPQHLVEDVRCVTELSSAIELKVKILGSRKFIYGYTTIDETGKEQFVRVYEPVIEAWLRRTNIKRYIRDAAQEYYTTWNVFVRMRATNDHSGIATIDVQESTFCRWGKQNQNDGSLDTVYVNANWQNIVGTDSPLVLTYPAINPYFDAAGQFRKDKSLKEFIYAIQGPDSDYTYYAMPPWNSFRLSKWIDVVKAIPIFKAALLKHQYAIKHHFEVSKDYLLFKYPDYDTMGVEDKKKTKGDLLDELDKQFEGAENAGKNILSLAMSNPNTGEMYPGLRITAIDDKIKDGIYIEDSQEGAQHAYNAMNLDATVANSLPGKNLGGSGSDKRVAFNILVNNSKMDEDSVLEPVDLAFEVNGFNELLGKKGIPTMMLKGEDIPEPQQQAKNLKPDSGL